MSPTELGYTLWVRETASEFESVPQTFSSWDNCMNKAYCKWPVIAGIIVGGVILLTVIACIVNCLCCGIRCCTCCCSCCCPKPRPKRAKFADDPYHQPPPMPAAMPPVNNTYNNSYETGFQGGYQTPQAPPTYRGAQVARFDTPSSPGLSKMNEDALPAMPTWEQGVNRRVEDTSPQPDSVEMEPLRPPQRTPSATAGGYMAPPQRTPSANSGGYMAPPQGTPSAPRAGPNGYMRPPPIRTNMQNDYSPDPHGYDEPNPYDYHGQTTGVIGHSPYDNSPYDHSPYDQPYRDQSPGGDFHAMSPPDHAYSTGPQYPVGIAVSPTTEMNRPVPFRQASPGLPYRQASPGPGVPFRTNSPAVPPFRQASPGSVVPFCSNSPAVGGVPPFRQPSPGFSQPSTQPPSYRAYSPASATASPSSPPPPFTTVPQEVSDPGRPPSLLQSGRKPAPNSFRDV
ncbi:hypothetical protein BDV19DRAFT_387118 [Aspergillus venezuelensis]